jgi:hypothetical protein
MRRVGKEGLVDLSLKVVWCEIYTLMGRPVRNAPFKYEFGFSPLNVSNRLFFSIKKIAPSVDLVWHCQRTLHYS